MKERRSIIVSVISICILIGMLVGYFTLQKDKICLVVKGKETTVSTFKKTVKDLLEEEEITYDKDDEITPNLDTKLKDKMNIKVVEVKKLKQTEYKDIPFEVKLVEDKELKKGTTKVTQKGENGEKELVYELTYKDGKLDEKKLTKESVSKEPLEQIVKKGTKKQEVAVSRGGSSSRQMRVVATAYAGDGITSTGTVPRWGTIAVDPSVIPYGSKVYIPQFGMTFRAEDCGGAIKGNRIDIFMGSESQAYSWGRKPIDIYVSR